MLNRNDNSEVCIEGVKCVVISESEVSEFLSFFNHQIHLLSVFWSILTFDLDGAERFCYIFVTVGEPVCLYCPYCLRLQWIFDIIIIIFPKITLSDVSSLRCHIVSIILSPHCFIIIVCCKNSHSTPDCPIPQFQLLCKEMEQF